MTFPFPTGGFLKYVPGAVNFDGTNDYLSRGAGFTGASDGKQFTLSFWVNIGVDQTNRIFTAVDTLAGTGLVVRSAVGATGLCSFVAENSAGTIILNVSTAASVLAASGWQHVIGSFDLTDTGKRHVYVNDVSDLPTITTYTDDTIDFTNADVAIGANGDGTNKLNGDLAEMWFTTTYIDLSVTANRRLFIDSRGKPVNLGQSGQKPTGTSPLLYLGGHSRYNGLTSAWNTNRGTGGGFTVTGALSDAATNPST
jgi:hypothetical protein